MKIAWVLIVFGMMGMACNGNIDAGACQAGQTCLASAQELATTTCTFSLSPAEGDLQTDFHWNSSSNANTCTWTWNGTDMGVTACSQSFDFLGSVAGIGQHSVILHALDGPGGSAQCSAQVSIVKELLTSCSLSFAPAAGSADTTFRWQSASNGSSCSWVWNGRNMGATSCSQGFDFLGSGAGLGEHSVTLKVLAGPGGPTECSAQVSIGNHQCHFDAQASCVRDDHFLPLVTHWQDGAFQYLGTDKPSIYAPEPFPEPADYRPGEIYSVYSVKTPDYQSSVGDRYALSQYSPEKSLAVFEDNCRASGTQVRLLPPMPWHDSDAVIEKPNSGICQVQIVHASLIDGSLVTVLLPPNWTERAPAGSYPIAFNSFYDINASLMEVHDDLLIDLVARSGHDGRQGVIGVLTNGSGALASRSMDERFYAQSAQAIAWVADTFHGNRHKIVTFGGSRGGWTSLALASNPYGYDYRVALAIAVVPPTKVGNHAELTGPTYPALLSAITTDTGLADAWMTGWTYPASLNRPYLSGLPGWLSYLYVLTGSSDLQEVNQNRSLISADFIAGLKAAGTQVYLEAGSHDHICPYHLQVEYGLRLIEAGIPLQAHVQLRAGHNSRTGDSGLGPTLRKAVDLLVAPGTQPSDPGPQLIEPGIHYWTVDRQSGDYTEIFPAQFPFTFEGPYQMAAGQTVPLVFTGPVDTQFTLSFVKDGQVIYALSDRISPTAYTVLWHTQPPGFTGGPYYYRLQIQKPGESLRTIPDTNTPSGTPAELWILDAEPLVSGDRALEIFSGPRAPALGGTNWGLSEF